MRAKHIKAEGTRKFFLIIPIVLILAALAVAYVYLPKAEASIVLKSDTINQNLEINLDKNQKTVDLTTVPAQLLDNEKEETKQFVSTGAKNNGTKATGTITLYNNGQDYKANVLIPAGTIITANGITFTTNKSQFIPPATFTQGPATLDSKGQPIPGAILTTAGTIDADVTATDAGESGNLAPSKFSVGNFDITKVYAQNKAAFSGGTTQNIKFVSSDDINKAEDSIKQDTIKDATGELLDKAKQSNLEIIDKQIQNEVVSINPDKQANDQADNFNITVRIKVFGLAFLDNDLRTAVVNSINSKIDSNKMLINPDQATLTYSVKNVDVDQGTATLSAQFSGSIGQKISADEVKSNIKNKSISAAKSYILGLDGVADVSITPWPSFNKMMPFLSSRVKVNFDYSK